MIEIIKDKVEMPEIHKQRFQKECKNYGSRKEEWSVIDTETKTIRYKGKFENVCLASHNLNKSNYRSALTKQTGV
jgi:hypothetical protein